MADVVLTLTIKDQYVTRATTAVTNYAGKNIRTVIDDKWDEQSWFYDAQQAGETGKDFAERMLKNLFINFIKHYEYNVDKVRYADDVADVVLPSEDVPSDIIE